MQPCAGVPGVSRKQQLLKRHRRNKRLGLLTGLVALVALGVFSWWWLPLLLLPLVWAAHEAWFADHLFYAPGEDYAYDFGEQAREVPASLRDGQLQADCVLQGDETLMLELQVKSSWLGRFLDPRVELGAAEQADRQTFERGVDGVRFLNLTGLAVPLQAGTLRLRGRHCRLQGQPRLWITPAVELQRRRVMVIAPHADDAELAAYGLYSQADETWVVTLTAGEIEANTTSRWAWQKPRPPA